MGRKSESRIEYELSSLKNQLKEEVMDELDDILLEKLYGVIRKAVAESLGNLLDFPLTVRQLAKLTGRTEDCIYKMCQRGQMPYTKCGKQIHMNLKDVSDQLLYLIHK